MGNPKRTIGRKRAPSASMGDARLVMRPQRERRLALAGGQELRISATQAHQQLTLLGRDGSAVLTIVVGADGARVELASESVSLEVKGELALRAGHLVLHGEHGVAVTTGQDLTIAASGDLSAVARNHTLRAELGDVALQANDDVRLNGERILVQC
jgi:uncharacterized protein (DUF2345 family)